MGKAFVYFYQNILKSKLGWVLVIAHFIILFYIFAQMTPISETPCHDQWHSPGWSTITGRSFHWTYESVLMLIFLLDIPAFFVSSIVKDLFFPADLCEYAESWAMALTVLFFASLQWLLIGFWLEICIKFWRTPKSSD